MVISFIHIVTITPVVSKRASNKNFIFVSKRRYLNVVVKHNAPELHNHSIKQHSTWYYSLSINNVRCVSDQPQLSVQNTFEIIFSSSNNFSPLTGWNNRNVTFVFWFNQLYKLPGCVSKTKLRHCKNHFLHVVTVGTNLKLAHLNTQISCHNEFFLHFLKLSF